MTSTGARERDAERGRVEGCWSSAHGSDAAHTLLSPPSCTDLVIPGPGKLQLVYTPEGGTPEVGGELGSGEGGDRACVARPPSALSLPQVHDVHDFEGAGVGLAMFNTDASIRGFAKACFEYALAKEW